MTEFTLKFLLYGFDKFIDQYYEEYLQFNPLEATQIADNRYNDRLPNDLTQTYREEIRQFCQRYLDSLQTFDRSQLTDQQQVSYDILKHETEQRLDLLKFSEHLMPVQQFWGLSLTMPLLGSGNASAVANAMTDFNRGTDDSSLGRKRRILLGASAQEVAMQSRSLTIPFTR